jgi:hypothetical protein
MQNRSNVVLELSDVYGKLIDDSLTVQLRNQSLSGLNQRFDVVTHGKPAKLKNVPAFPNGISEMTVKPARYMMTSQFLNVPAGQDLSVRLMVFLQPDSAKPLYPTFNLLPQDVRQLLKRSKITADGWKNMDPLWKAGLLNICAKARTIEVQPGRTLADCFRKLIQQRPERIFALVDPDLHQLVLALPRAFGQVSGLFHKFPEGWKMLDQQESFKTDDRVGNLQITFAADTSGEGLLMVDADLDDHSGVRHVFDVLKHAITQQDTHPYNIHQILQGFQNLDPGYRLA